MAVKKRTVEFRQIGRNLNVVIDGEPITRTGTSDVLKPLKELAKIARDKPTKANIDALIKALKPKTEAKEKEKTEVKAQVKKAKKEAKVSKTKLKRAKISKDGFIDVKEKLSSVELTPEQKKELLRVLQIEEKAPVPAPKSTIHSRGEY